MRLSCCPRERRTSVRHGIAPVKLTMPTPVLDVRSAAEAPHALARAAEVLRRGGLVAFPTETVYGLGADALDAAAVARIFEAKGRPANNPLIVHVADVEDVHRLVADWPDEAAKLAERF